MGTSSVPRRPHPIGSSWSSRPPALPPRLRHRHRRPPRRQLRHLLPRPQEGRPPPTPPATPTVTAPATPTPAQTPTSTPTNTPTVAAGSNVTLNPIDDAYVAGEVPARKFGFGAPPPLGISPPP